MNLEQVRLSSVKAGFVLSDALIAAAVVSALSLLAYSAVKQISQAEQHIEEAYQETDERYTDVMIGIGECICSTEELEEDPAATS